MSDGPGHAQGGDAPRRAYGDDAIRTGAAGVAPASIFVSHGAPSLPLDDVPARDFLRGLGARLPRPRAIVAISAHTVAHGVAVGSAPRMHAVHDFGGFPDALYALRYDPPGDPALATRVAGLLAEAGIEPTGEVPIDGLDHGIWVPLMLMYPQADIPVVVVSLDARMDAEMHVAVGRALAGLHDEGVLVMGSGSVTHNLRDVFSRGPDAPVAPYARRFADWVSAAVRDGGADLLQDWSIAPEAARSHPTPEHFVPLLVAAGAGGRGTVMHESFTAGALAMHAYAFEPLPQRGAPEGRVRPERVRPERASARARRSSEGPKPGDPLPSSSSGWSGLSGARPVG